MSLVYVVSMQYDNPEEWYPVGVYSSIEKANRAIDEFRLDGNENNLFRVEVLTLD